MFCVAFSILRALSTRPFPYTHLEVFRRELHAVETNEVRKRLKECAYFERVFFYFPLDVRKLSHASGEWRSLASLFRKRLACKADFVSLERASHVERARERVSKGMTGNGPGGQKREVQTRCRRRRRRRRPSERGFLLTKLGVDLFHFFLSMLFLGIY